MPVTSRTTRSRPAAAWLVAALTGALLTSIAVRAAVASPPLPVNPAAIEPLAPYVGQSTCDPTIKPGTAALRTLVHAAYPITGDLGITRDCAIGGTSEHKEGRAWDWAVNAYSAQQDAAAKDMFAWLFATDGSGHTYAMARRLGIMYMIYNQHIWSASNADAGWRPYTGPNPHVDHVHISLSWPGALKTTSYWVAGPPPSNTPTGAILAEWSGLAAAAGPLGAPTGPQYDVAGGRAQNFSGGRIYTGAGTGTHAVYGGIYAAYVRLGGHAVLGLPVSDEGDVPGGRVSSFQYGRVLWSGATGAHSVVGLIGARYDGLGGPGGYLGLPTTDELAVPGGRASAFQGGRLFWSPATGPQSVVGIIGDRYDSLGGPARYLGLPTTDEVAVPGGRLSSFQGGRIFWSPATGARSVVGIVGARYDALGGPGGPLGLPTTDELAVVGGRASSFRGGRIAWSPTTGAHAVTDPVLAYYDAQGGAAGFLGLPVDDLAAPTPAVQAQTFTGGHAYVQGGQALSVRGAIDARYQALGGVTGPLGPPRSSEYDIAGGRRSDFLTGHLSWDAATGIVTQS